MGTRLLAISTIASLVLGIGAVAEPPRTAAELAAGHIECAAPLAKVSCRGREGSLADEKLALER